MARSFIRSATVDDLEAINRIYNHYVLTSTCTYQEEPEPMEARQAWFDRHGRQHPVIVAEVDSQIVGWGALSPFHPRSAYRRTVENAVYVDDTQRGRGYGRLLLNELIAAAGAVGHRSIIALIDSDQPASLALHESVGFTRAGHIREAGFKMNRWLDVIYLQKML